MKVLSFKKDKTLIVGALIFAVLGIVPFIFSSYIMGVLTIALYFSVFVMSWDLLFGYSGEVNFGPTVQIGIGAYVAALLNLHTALPLALCIGFGAIAAVISGLALVGPALRLRGPYFGLITLVAVLLLEQFITIFAQYTGGEIGISVQGILSVSPIINYYYSWIFGLITSIILIIIAKSPIGLILQASAQDPIEAESLGFNVTKYKIFAFSVSAFFSGLAGALLIFYLGTASVSLVIAIAVVLEIIIADIVGGRRTIIGGILGALFIILFREWLQPIGELSYVIVSAACLAVLLFFPNGIISIVLRRR